MARALILVPPRPKSRVLLPLGHSGHRKVRQICGPYSGTDEFMGTRSAFIVDVKSVLYGSTSIHADSRMDAMQSAGVRRCPPPSITSTSSLIA